jgi:hypothetical protein
MRFCTCAECQELNDERVSYQLKLTCCFSGGMMSGVTPAIIPMWKHPLEIILDLLLDFVGEHSEHSRRWWKMACVVALVLFVVGMCVYLCCCK